MSKGATSKKPDTKSAVSKAHKAGIGTAATTQLASRKTRSSRSATPKPAARPKEEGRLHTRVLKCTLELANSCTSALVRLRLSSSARAAGRPRQSGLK